MSRSSRSLLSLVRRCVAVTEATLPTGVPVAAGGGFVQQRTWTSATRAGCFVVLPRLGQLRSAPRTGQLGHCTKAGAPYEDETPALPSQDKYSALPSQDEYSALPSQDEYPPLPSQDEYPPLPSYQSDPEPEKKDDVYLVQVKGLPWTSTAEDILQFFSDCRIRDGVKGIHLTKNLQGRPSGRAYIEMEHESDVLKALEKHRQYLGPRYVEVYEVTDSNAEIILQKIQPLAESRVVRLLGLPYMSTEDDIVQFFSGLDIEKDGITIVTDHKGRNSGMAFVQFCSPEAVAGALQRNGEYIGKRFIEVFPSTIEEIHPHWKRRLPMELASEPADISGNPRTGSPQSSGEMLHYVHMRGLPYKVKVEDIVQFFSPLIVSKILFECNTDGRPKGECAVYFSCHKDAAAAMTRDRRYLGERYIELFLNSRTKYDGR